MNLYVIIHFILIIALELPVYLYFFREEKLTAVHFTFLCNAFTFFLAHILIATLGFSYYPVQFFVFLLEACIIFFFWDMDFKKSLLISLMANGISFSVFEIIDRVNFSLPF